MPLPSRSLYLLPLLLGSSLCVPCFAAATLQAQDAPAAGDGPRVPRAVRVSGGVMASMLLKHEDPKTPAEARAQHMGGAVVLSVLITEEGKVETATAVTGPEILREAAVAAVREWTYKPFQLNGRPVPVQTTVTVHFDPGS